MGIWEVLFSMLPLQLHLTMELDVSGNIAAPLQDWLIAPPTGSFQHSSPLVSWCHKLGGSRSLNESKQKRFPVFLNTTLNNHLVKNGRIFLKTLNLGGLFVSTIILNVLHYTRLNWRDWKYIQLSNISHSIYLWTEEEKKKCRTEAQVQISLILPFSHLV